jgi:hypothetical protein
MLWCKDEAARELPVMLSEIGALTPRSMMKKYLLEEG